jgi:hypothetical protein
MKTHVVITVWGEVFTDLLVRYLLPSLGNEGNLPALAAGGHPVMRLYTTPEDALRIRNCPAFPAIENILPVSFVDLASVRVEEMPEFAQWGPWRFKTMNACHLHAMREAWKEDATLSFLAADNILSDGAFARALEVFRTGKRAVLAASFPVWQEVFGPALEARHPAGPDGIRRLPPRHLVQQALDHPHPTLSPPIDAPGTFDSFKPLRWSLGPEGCLDHGWAGNPILIHPRKVPDHFFLAVDVDYTSYALDGMDEVHFETDSDRIALLEMMPEDSGREHRPQPFPFTPLRYALGSEGLVHSEHSLEFGRFGTRWHGGTCSQGWERTGALAREALDQTIAWMKFLEGTCPTLPDHPGAGADLEATLRRLYALARTPPPPESPRQAPHAWANIYKLQAALGHRQEALEAMAATLDASPPCPNPARAARVAVAAARLEAWELLDRALAMGRALDPSDHRLLQAEALDPRRRKI